MRTADSIDTVISKAKRAKILELENADLKAEVERLQAENRAYRQLVDRFQEDAVNKRALEQAERRQAVKLPMTWEGER